MRKAEMTMKMAKAMKRMRTNRISPWRGRDYTRITGMDTLSPTSRNGPRVKVDSLTRLVFDGVVVVLHVWIRWTALILPFLRVEPERQFTITPQPQTITPVDLPQPIDP